MKFFTAVLVFSFLLSGHQAFALAPRETITIPSPPPPTYPALEDRVNSQRLEQVEVKFPQNLPAEVRYFKHYISVPAVDVVVPTVVGVPISNEVSKRNIFLVKERETGTIVGSYYKRVYSDQGMPLNVQVVPLVGEENTLVINQQYLVDGKLNTAVDFNLSETDKGSVKISISAPEAITTSELRFSLAANVSYPETVSIQAKTAEGLKTIVATKDVSGTVVKFPQTTAEWFEVTFTYAQPLRMSEILLVPDNVSKSVDQTLRFLAQPQMSYDIYLNADTSVVVPASEAGNLAQDKGVLLLGQYPVWENTNYVPSDIDEDGVPDALDNCTNVFNPDQADIDGSGKGDVCEDFDRDGRMNSIDNCPDVPNSNQRDEDGDGIGDVCDDEESRFTERNKWVPWVGIGMAAIVIGVLFALVATGTRRKDSEPENDTASNTEGGGEGDGD